MDRRALQRLYVLTHVLAQELTVSTPTAQPARNLAMDLDDRRTPVRFLIRDRDTKFGRAFDDVLRSERARVILTPIRVPNANAYAKRVIETIWAACLDWSLILGRRHLSRRR